MSNRQEPDPLFGLGPAMVEMHQSVRPAAVPPDVLDFCPRCGATVWRWGDSQPWEVAEEHREKMRANDPSATFGAAVSGPHACRAKGGR